MRLIKPAFMVINTFTKSLANVGFIRMITRFISLFLALFLALFLGLGYLATEQGSAWAQSPVASVPQFMPTGAWSVEQTFLSKARSLRGIKLPCMMANSYDNGYILRLSGGGGTFLAMAIDFKQNVFKPGRKYDSIVSLSNGYTNRVKATAFSKSVLIFNVRSFSGFYQALQGANSMIVDVEGNPLQFSFGNFIEAIQRLETCFGGVMPVPMGIPSVGGALAPMPVGMMALPEPPAPEEKSTKTLTPVVPKWDDRVSPKPPLMPSNYSQPSQMFWEAKAGDDLRMTLERWSARAGVNVAWQSDRGGKVVNDLRVSGSFEDAVQNLMAQNAAAMGLEANLMGGQSAVASPSSPQQLAPSRIGGSSQGMVGRGSVKWNAPAGSSLQQVLSIWSKQVGVELLWEANQGFAVKRSVNTNGSYESALQLLLDQFSNDSPRPAVQLNNDPVSGRRVLLVQSTRI